MQSLRSNDADLVVGGMTPGSQETSVDLALEQLLLIVPRSFNLVPPWAYSGNSAENPYEITPKQLQNLPLILPSAANDIGGITRQALEHFDNQSAVGHDCQLHADGGHARFAEHGYLFTSPVFLGMQIGVSCIEDRLLHDEGHSGYQKDRRGLSAGYLQKGDGRTVYRASAHSRPSGEAGTVSAFGMSFRQKNDFVLSVYQFQTQN